MNSKTLSYSISPATQLLLSTSLHQYAKRNVFLVIELGFLVNSKITKAVSFRVLPAFFTILYFLIIGKVTLTFGEPFFRFIFIKPVMEAFPTLYGMSS